MNDVFFSLLLIDQLLQRIVKRTSLYRMPPKYVWKVEWQWIEINVGTKSKGMSENLVHYQHVILHVDANLQLN